MKNPSRIRNLNDAKKLSVYLWVHKWPKQLGKISSNTVHYRDSITRLLPLFQYWDNMIHRKNRIVELHSVYCIHWLISPKVMLCGGLYAGLVILTFFTGIFKCICRACRRSSSFSSLDYHIICDAEVKINIRKPNEKFI